MKYEIWYMTADSEILLEEEIEVENLLQALAHVRDAPLVVSGEAQTISISIAEGAL